MQKYGSIELMVCTSDKSKKFTIDINKEELGNTAIRLMIDSGGLYCYNGSIIQKIIDIENYKWYKVKIDFESTNGAYETLNKFKWKAVINGSEYGVYGFQTNLSSVNYLSLYSDINNYNYNIYLNDITYSWQTSIKDIIYYAHTKLMEKLKVKPFDYFIKSNDKDYYDRWGKNMNSDYGYFCLNIDDFLLSNLFKERVYDYGHYNIYKS